VVSKGIAKYGTFLTYEPVFQRYWIRRNDGVLQRYWKKTSRMKKVGVLGRFEFRGSGRDLMKAVIESLDRVPIDRHVEVSAEEFLERPKEYSVEGTWVESRVVS
jgi:hypothetical protein